jgi:hypothetical protein
MGMMVKQTILTLLGLMLLVGLAAAALPLNVTVTSDHSPLGLTDSDWLISNNVDQSTIHVVVTYANSSGVKNATVSFSVVDPLTGDPITNFGTMSPASVITGNDGTADGIFKVKTKSGDATINVDVLYPAGADTYHNFFRIIQRIDHDSPYLANFHVPAQGTVASDIPMIISLTDRWGNIIDNRKITAPSDNHSVSLHVNGPTPNDGGFNSSGIVHDIALPVDSNGNVTVSVKLSSRAGDNYVRMDPMGSIMTQVELITGTSNGIPFYITQTWNPDAIPPSYPTKTADGVSTFTYAYTLLDKFGNPTQGQSIWINSTAGDHTLATSMLNGQVWGNYGPFSFTGIYNVTATALQNSSVTISKAVRFYNTTPTNIALYGNPMAMPSVDSKPMIQVQHNRYCR